MKVYIVRVYDWDYDQILGVFSSHKRARKCLETDNSPPHRGMAKDISTWEVNKGWMEASE